MQLFTKAEKMYMLNEFNESEMPVEHSNPFND